MSEFGAQWGLGDVVGLCLDLRAHAEGGQIAFFRNGTLVGTASLPHGKQFYPMIKVNSDGDAFTLNVEDPVHQQTYLDYLAPASC